ncbi:hypothetical protein ACFWIQ_11855 [Kitasatospora sp. NPDC127059]|uniref:hypothetical protein n=1 Tax=unclassified Kitasatospora TaxID=2633591 RepID=UPI0036698AD7
MVRYVALIGALAATGLAMAVAPGASQGQAAPRRVGFFAEAPLPEGDVPLAQLPLQARRQLSPWPSKVRAGVTSAE